VNGRKDSRRTFSKTAAGAVLGALAGGLLLYARKAEPENVEITHVPLTLPRLAPSFDGYRIAQIGDIHADGWMTPGRLLELVKLVNTEEPDLVAITGDFATYSWFRSLVRYVPGLAAPLRRLCAPDGIVTVLGNHDHKTDAEAVRRVLTASGVVELRNAVRTLRRNGAALHLCGVDSVKEGMDRLDLVLRELPKEGAAVLLAHEPDFANISAATGRFDLQLSGHSHGGQAHLPTLGSLFVPPLSRKYPSGLYKVGEMLLYTNRGLGAHPRFRFLCRPEITILTLRSPGG
jgi:predicted MPP superfamily phosphohydrolase